MSDPNPPTSSSTIDYSFSLPQPAGVPPRPRYWLHALLLLATCFTTLVVGARMQYNFLHDRPAFAVGDDYLPFFPLKWTLEEPSRLLLGVPFSATLLTILLAHEMGHYLCCRYYEVRATLPFFIPAPTLIGTLGAVIRIKGRIRSRAALFDIGIAGPIAGFVVAALFLAIGLGLSKPLVAGIGASDLRIGLPEIFFLMHRWLRFLAPTRPIASLPLARVYLHPTAIAAWVGMYATALNLLPSSQLDGGHIVYAVAPRAHRTISWITVAALILMGRVNYVWWFWAGLITLMNILTYRQQQAPEYPTLPANRIVWALAAIAMLALTLTISPIQTN